jgi:uncharacterized SAM-binding protein YcdF (DUF218 family)
VRPLAPRQRLRYWGAKPPLLARVAAEVETTLPAAPVGATEVRGATRTRAEGCHGKAPSKKAPSKKAFTLASALAGLLLAFLTASSVLFVWPASDKPQHTDAVVVLDGNDEAARAQTALRLVREGYAQTILFSQGAYRSTPCPHVPQARVVCFLPVPGRTVGEVEFAARYARARGWRSLMVITGHEQATRARLLLRRCFSGKLVVVPAATDWVDVPYEVLYEWGALAKALIVQTGC